MRYIYFACYIVLVAGASNCKEEKVFRSDYQYYTEADGWFKLHQMPLNWQKARLQCAYEGAMLASPTTYGLTAVIRSLVAKHKIVVYTGIHATVSDGNFHSMDGIPFSEIPVRWMAGNPNNYNNNENCIIYNSDGVVGDIECKIPFPYICYKKHSSDLIMTECGTTDKGYKMDHRTNKCYKFHRMGRTFSVAAAICSAEGGHLAIINSEIEAEVMRNLFEQNPAHTLNAAYADGALLGYLNWDDSNYFGTLEGQSLEEAGYEKWSDGQPTHQHSGKPQRCGGMYRNALLDDMYCDENFVFICEKHPDSLRKSTIDIRFSQNND